MNIKLAPTYFGVLAVSSANIQTLINETARYKRKIILRSCCEKLEKSKLGSWALNLKVKELDKMGLVRICKNFRIFT